MRLRRQIGLLISLLGVTFILLLGSGSAASAQTNAPIVVNDTGNGEDSNLNDGTCRTSNGRCTLRAAISQSNRNPGPDTINFNISGNGPHLSLIHI